MELHTPSAPAEVSTDPTGALQGDSLSGLKALVVDDEPGMRHFLEKALNGRFNQVDTALSLAMAKVLIEKNQYASLILDVTLPDGNGVEWLDELRKSGFNGDVILITGYADMNTAIQALRAGATDFLQKPFRIDQLWHALDRAADQSRLRRENFVLRRTVHSLQQTDHAMVGDSVVMRNLRRMVARIAQSGSTVLLTGESGSGKEVLARAIHAQSARASGPFVPVNCAAISPELIESELFGHVKGAFTGATQNHPGLFYYAQGGTLFLDEIGELPLAMQTKLLRVLEERTIRPVGSSREIDVDVRIVAATNVNLSTEVGRGRFRQDLFYRLSVLPIEMPPLRARRDDIPDLVRFFLGHFARKLRLAELSIDASIMARIQSYDWPGNVRELKNYVERSMILGYFSSEELPLNLSVDDSDSGDSSNDGAQDEGSVEQDKLELIEKRHILKILEQSNGNKSEAARRLGISRKTLERKCLAWEQD